MKLSRTLYSLLLLGLYPLLIGTTVPAGSNTSEKLRRGWHREIDVQAGFSFAVPGKAVKTTIKDADPEIVVSYMCRQPTVAFLAIRYKDIRPENQSPLDFLKYLTQHGAEDMHGQVTHMQPLTVANGVAIAYEISLPQERGYAAEVIRGRAFLFKQPDNSYRHFDLYIMGLVSQAKSAKNQTFLTSFRQIQPPPSNSNGMSSGSNTQKKQNE